MTDEKKMMKMQPKRSHSVVVEERSRLTVSGVTDIERFDEEEVVVATELGLLSIKGQGLHLNKIDVEDGELSVEGELDSLSYEEQSFSDKGSFFAKLFR